MNMFDPTAYLENGTTQIVNGSFEVVKHFKSKIRRKRGLPLLSAEDKMIEKLMMCSGIKGVPRKL